MKEKKGKRIFLDGDKTVKPGPHRRLICYESSAGKDFTNLKF